MYYHNIKYPIINVNIMYFVEKINDTIIKT